MLMFDRDATSQAITGTKKHARLEVTIGARLDEPAHRDIAELRASRHVMLLVRNGCAPCGEEPVVERGVAWRRTAE